MSITYFYTYSKTSKEFISKVEAKENPLVEGEFMLPSDSTLVAIPTLTDTEKAVWNAESGEWDKEDIVVEDDSTPTRTLQNAIDEKISSIKSEAHDRIVALYTTFKQLNILMGGDSTAISNMNTTISGITSKSDELESDVAELATIELVDGFDETDNSKWS